MNQAFAPIVRELKALFGMLRTMLLVTVVLGAGIAGGYVGGILAAADLDRTRYSSNSPGVPGIEAITVNHGSGTFEDLGRVVDQFNAQLDENWRTWESLGTYIFFQGMTEIRRAWSGPTARPSAASATSDI